MSSVSKSTAVPRNYSPAGPEAQTQYPLRNSGLASPSPQHRQATGYPTARRPSAQRDYQEVMSEAGAYAARAARCVALGDYSEASRNEQLAADVLHNGKREYQHFPPVYQNLEELERNYAVAAKQYADYASSQPSNSGPLVAAAAVGAAAAAVLTANATGNGNTLNCPEGGTDQDLTDMFVVDRPKVSWDDVIGADDAKISLQEAVIEPLLWPQLFEGEGMEPFSGILLFGPPGTGKTMLAQAAAGSTKCAFFNVSAANILHHHVGQSERKTRALFEAAKKHAPAIIFLDECDSLLRERSDDETDAVMRVKTEFFKGMQGFNPSDRVLFVGATNLAGKLDKAALRRFEKRIWVGAPDESARAALFAHKLRGRDSLFTTDECATFAHTTPGYTGADIKIVVKDATQMARRRITHASHFKRDAEGWMWPTKADDPAAEVRPEETSTMKVRVQVTADDVLTAIRRNPPAVSAAGMKKYQDHFAQALAT